MLRQTYCCLDQTASQLTEDIFDKYQKAAERGGYGGERYEQLEFQKKVAQSYHKLFDASWKVTCLASSSTLEF